MLEFIPGSGNPLISSCLAQTDSLPIEAAAGDIAGPPSLSLILFFVTLVAVAYLLIQAGLRQSKALLTSGILVAVAATVITAGLLPANLAAYISYAFCALAVTGAIKFLASREPVYAALGFTTAILSTCGILFMQSALFVAAATMIVYAGATIIIFLFVLMFAQQTHLHPYDIKLTNPLLATVIGGVMMTAIAVCVLQPGAVPDRRIDETRLFSVAGMASYLTEKEAVAVAENGAEAVVVLEGEGEGEGEAVAAVDGPPVVTFREPGAVDSDDPHIPVATAELGRALYTDYLATVELAGVLLLVAVIGAIALATRTTPEVRG